MIRISQHLTLSDCTKSGVAARYGIDNKPGIIEIEAIKLLAENVYEPLWEKFRGRFLISSWYRCRMLNDLVNGAKHSQHTKGEAVDLDADWFRTVSNWDLFHFIRERLTFDQVIAEYSNPDGSPCWVHVSYKKEGNRGQALTSFREGKYTQYQKYEHGI